MLLDEFLRGLREGGGEAEKLRVGDLDISPCRECLACYQTGECVIKDEMERLVSGLLAADKLVLAAPIFFYGLPAGLKALIDRGQVFWVRKTLLSLSPPRPGRPAFAILTGATGGEKLFDGALLTLNYFLENLGVNLVDKFLLRKTGGPAGIPDKTLAKIYRAGYNFAGPVSEI